MISAAAAAARATTTSTMSRSTLLRGGVGHHSPPIAYSYQALTRWQSRTVHYAVHRPTDVTRFMGIMSVWQRNLSRLYARRMLELLAAAAATSRLKCELESQMNKPQAWNNWESKDWEDTALASIGNSRLSRWCLATARIVNLALLSTPLVIMLPLSYVIPPVQHVAWSYALWGIEQSGPTWIKLVQWATTRQDLFSPEFCQYFGKLRDDTVGHPWKETERIMAEELGSHWRSKIDMDPKPIGSGCIAQVYRGELRDASGQYPKDAKVAVKVQHPGIWTKVCLDFYILHKGAQLLEDLPYLGLKYLSLVDTVRQFRNVMLPQLDLSLEAKHLDRFNRDFASDAKVEFPRPIVGLSTPQVLTETFIEGTPIMEYVNASKETRQQLALIGLETTLKMIFLNDFVHGDLHPGNILVSGQYPNLKMNMLDCGLVLEMGPEQHVNLVKVLGAFTRRDGTLAGQLMVDLKAESQAGPKDIELFVRGIEQICEMDAHHNFIEKVGDYITDICYMACVHRVKLEGAFVNAALAVEIMEGIAAALYPDMKVQRVALPLIVKAEMMHRMGLH